jgi:hypothetical protein
MNKIITTLTAVTFALGLAAAAQAQVSKTPEKPVVKGTQAVQPQVAPKEAAKPGEPVAKESVKPVDKTKKAAKGAKQVAKQADTQGKTEKKAAAPLVKTPEGAK